MLENLVNSMLGYMAYGRLKQWKKYATVPGRIQDEQLSFLLKRGARTEYGRQYGFGELKNYESFARRVPLTDYGMLHPYIQRMQAGEKDILWPGRVRYYAQSSGTTSTRSKYIPVTDEILENNHFRGGKDMLLTYLNLYPDSKILYGKALKLGGTTRYVAGKDIYIGDLSGIMIARLPRWAQIKSTPPPEVALLADWTEKLDRIARQSVNEDVRSLVGIPTWFIKLLQQILENTGASAIAEIWPGLEVFFHGGISFAPYKHHFERLAGKPVRFMEIYNASEGFFAMQDDPASPDLLLMLDYRVFYEFIPMDRFDGTASREVIPLTQVKPGVNYAMVITTASGLWRYILGDTVRFTSTAPYKIQITGRTKHFLNLTGEEVVVANTDRALRQTAEAFGLHVVDYTVSGVPPSPTQPGYHEWLIELADNPEDPAAFARLLDENLRRLNSDYDIKRHKNISLGPLKLHLARRGLFDRWLASKNKLGGQHKIPRLSADRSILEELLEMNREMGGV